MEMHPRRMSAKWVFVAASLQFACCAAIGAAEPDSTSAGTTTPAGELAIGPTQGMLDVLAIPLEDRVAGLFRCDFSARRLRSVEFRLAAIKDHELSELGKVIVETPESYRMESVGTFYFAFLTTGGNEGTMTQLLSLGVSTERTQQCLPIKEFKIDPKFVYKSNAKPTHPLPVQPGTEIVVWSACYETKEAHRRPKTVQELVDDTAPLTSLDPAKIIESAKSMDVIVILATATGRQGERLRPRPSIDSVARP